MSTFFQSRRPCSMLVAVFWLIALSGMITFYINHDVHLDSTSLSTDGKGLKSNTRHVYQSVAHQIWSNISLVTDITVLNPIIAEALEDVPHTYQLPKIHAVTYASHGGRDDRFCRAVESSIRNDIDIVILGWDIKWTGLSQKLQAAHSYVKSLPPSDIILFTDAYDVLFTDKITNIHEKFLSLSNRTNSKIIFSAECGCWPHVMEDKNICLFKYPMSPTPYRYLNSGTWIGYAKDSVIMLQEIIKEAGNDFLNANDQKLVADMYINNRNGIKLDFFNEIFQSMHMTLDPPLPYCNPIQDIILTSNKTYYNKRTNTIPSVIHFNGGGKTHHLEMESKIWYQDASYNTKERREKLASYLLNVPTYSIGRMRFDVLCGAYVQQMNEKWGL